MPGKAYVGRVGGLAVTLGGAAIVTGWSSGSAAPDFSLLFTGNFFQALAPFLAGGLLSNLTGLLAPVAPAVDAVDQETAAAQQVADAYGIPFLGVDVRPTSRRLALSASPAPDRVARQ